MTLGWKLFLVFLGFLALMGTVMVMTFRERRKANEAIEGDREAEAQSDARVLATIFAATLGGLGLTVLVAYLVFL